jgi:hypothetical protein
MTAVVAVLQLTCARTRPFVTEPIEVHNLDPAPQELIPRSQADLCITNSCGMLVAGSSQCTIAPKATRVTGCLAAERVSRAAPERPKFARSFSTHLKVNVASAHNVSLVTLKCCTYGNTMAVQCLSHG